MLKRRLKLKTDYKQRLALLRSRLPRIVIRRTNNNIKVQIVEFTSTGDKTIAEANSSDVKKAGWKGHGGNISSAYLVGYTAARKSSIKKAIPDFGMQFSRKGTSLYAALKGAADAGMEIPSGDVFPDEKRISGKHIAEYAKTMKIKDKNTYEKLFSSYIKNGVNPEELDIEFEKIKGVISKEA